MQTQCHIYTAVIRWLAPTKQSQSNQMRHEQWEQKMSTTDTTNEAWRSYYR